MLALSESGFGQARAQGIGRSHSCFRCRADSIPTQNVTEDSWIPGILKRIMDSCSVLVEKDTQFLAEGRVSAHSGTIYDV